MRDFSAYTLDQVCRLTGLTRRQLAYWDRTGFFSPACASENRSAPYSRVYTFKDVVGLRTIARLRKAPHSIHLRELRQVASWLDQHPAESWPSLVFFIAGKHVYFDDPESGVRLAARPKGQSVLPISMAPIMAEMRAEIESLKQRTPDMIGRVERRRYVAHNAPVLAGTRIPTSAVWNLAKAGYDAAAIVREYPRLHAEDVEGALAYETKRHLRAG
ncbi:MAG TPA: DUF433 domain-containing protein [Dehalococcoidia bacterium]|nr:DUF433 domain-containing protein [Dehalococcoidia bacterium]